VRDAQGNVLAVYQHVYAPGGGVGPLKLKEHHVYGSSRLGIVRRDVDVTSILNPKKTPVPEDLIGNTYVYTAERGWKLYELTNHLGNVLVTVTDKKIGVPSSGNNSSIDHYTADVVSASDYYPFGMLMPGRNYRPDSYRFGFGGQEKSSEIKGEGNSYTAEFWEYDPRLGRRWNLDPRPLTSQSVYSTFRNNPLSYVDQRGDTAVIGLNGRQQIRYVGGQWIDSRTRAVINVNEIENV
jgi:RHS repeat-associated protein